jgi:hypothetical protein
MGKSTWDGPIRSKNGFEFVQDVVQYYDDFIGAGNVVIPAAGSAESGMDWVSKIVGAAPPTVGGKADVHGGAVECALTADSQKQDAGLYHNDQRNFDVRKKAVIDVRFKVSVLPTTSVLLLCSVRLMTAQQTPLRRLGLRW